jgi:hypothetical protein
LNKTAHIYHLFLKSNFNISRRDILDYVNDRIKIKEIALKRSSVLENIFYNYSVKSHQKNNNKSHKEELYNNTVMKVLSRNPTLKMVLTDDHNAINTFSMQPNKVKQEDHIVNEAKKHNNSLIIDEVDDEQFKEVYVYKQREKLAVKTPLLTESDLRMISFYNYNDNSYKDDQVIIEKDSKLSEDFLDRLGDISPIIQNKSADSINVTLLSKTLFGRGFSKNKRHLTQMQLNTKMLSMADIVCPKKKSTKIQVKLPQGILDDISEIESLND